MSDTTSNGGSSYTASYHPRLCHLTKWDDFNGYGFNLHAEKGKAGQYIGKVDEGSPAVAAQLRQGDRIVEVNGVNIGNENHQQVVQRIKAGGEETKLLVVDAETDLYFKEKKIVVRGDMPEVVYCKTPLTSDVVTDEKPVHVNSNHTDSEAHLHNEETGELTQEFREAADGANDSADGIVTNGVEEVSAPETVEEITQNGVSEVLVGEPTAEVEETLVSEISEPEVPPEPEPELAPVVTEPVAEIPEPEPIVVPEPVVVPEPEAVPEPEPVVETPKPVVETPKTDDVLDFGNVSVQEMKRRIQSKKKVDTRFSQMGLKEKYDLLQRL